MNKLKAGKGALKDYHRYLADEYDDYAEEPEQNDPISHIPNIKTYQMESTLQKPKIQKPAIKHTSRYPKYKPGFNLEAYSQGILDGVFGEKVAKFLKISDLARLSSTCRYFSRIFGTNVIWINQMLKSHRNLHISDQVLSTINVRQFFKYLHCSRNNGIVFDTVSLARDMKDEDKLLARNLVDFVSIKSQKANELMHVLAQKGVLTRDLKVSWIKERNQVCVWVSGFSPQRKELCPFACQLYTKSYEDHQIIRRTYFLNDHYFAVELEEGLTMRTFEVFAVEADPEWYEKKQAAFCKQVLTETFTEKIENIKVKSVGDFLVFVFEKEKQMLSIQVFDMNGKCRHKSEDVWHLDAGFSDIILAKSVTESSFRLYLLDKEANVYLVDYSLESSVTIKRMEQPKTIKEEEEEKEEMQLFDNKEVGTEQQENQRFPDVVKMYHYGTHKKINEQGQSQTVEYLVIYKEKRFYLMKFDANQLIHCDLPQYDVNSKLSNWTVSEDFLYLLIGTTIWIYQLDFNNYSALFYKQDSINKSKLESTGARWILVNPCVTVVLSTSSLKEFGMGTVRASIGSTQKLLLSRKSYPFEWVPDECSLYNMLGHIEKWQDVSLLEQEKMECKLEDEKLLIVTNLRSYFRDFNVCDERVGRQQHGWKLNPAYDVRAGVGEEGSKKVAKTEKKEKVQDLLAHENKNKKNPGNQNWKNVEKKEETEERIEKKESRKKGDKYYKNVRQGKHRDKMFD